MKSIKFIFAAVLTLLTVLSSGQDINSKYRISRKINLPGDGGWDYLTVDEQNNRLFVSHGTVVHVVDLATGQLIKTISETPGVHGIALAYKTGKAFISEGRNASVKIVDLKSLNTVGEVKVTGENPDAIMFDDYSSQVFVFNGRTSNATVIDANTGTVTATIVLAGKPEFPVSDGNGKIFVNIEDKSLISVIDSKTYKVLSSWSIAPGEEPSGLAYDASAHRLFTVCANRKLIVIDSETGKLIEQLPIGEGCDGVKFDPDLKRIYSSNGEGTLTIAEELSADKFAVLGTFKTTPGARTLAVDTRTHHIYTPAAEFVPAQGTAADNARQRPQIKPGSFFVLDIELK
jgi:DNA-binding beta-propeller fold protein YncE